MPCAPGDRQLAELGAWLVDDPQPPAPGDWNGLVERAVAERVAPLLDRRLPPDAPIGAEQRARLKRERYRTAALNEILYRELERLLEAGARTGLGPPVVLKGGALAADLYEEIALRPMSDIDLFVREPELRGWVEASRALGFEPSGPEMAAGLAARVHYQRALSNERATIELHVGLVGGRSDWRSPDPEWVFERAVGFRPLGSRSVEALRLDATAHLLYACAHAVLQHGTAQAPLVWIYDLHAIATRWRERISWKELVLEARELRWAEAVARGLALSRELFRTSIPEDVEADLSASDVARRHADRKADPRLSRAELVWRDMACLDASDRARWALAILFPSPAYMKWRYPRAGALWPALYPYRWSVVLREGLSALASRARA